MTSYTEKLAVSVLRRILVLTAIFASWTFSNYDQHGTFVVTGVAAVTATTVVIADTLARHGQARAWRRIRAHHLIHPSEIEKAATS